MKLSQNQRRRQQSHNPAVPAAIEAVESRQLLTTVPTILSPTGIVDTATPEITWTPVEDAVSYDVWITSLQSFETILVQEGITATEFTPESELSLGDIRIWVRAKFADETIGDWSASSEFTIESRPTVTGPTGPGNIPLIVDSTPTIQWTSANGASYFQIWLADTTTGNPTVYNVRNLTPLLDENGDPVLDPAGNEILQEIRSFTIPDSDALELGRYRVWVRSFSQTGDISDWSEQFDFNAGLRPENLAPSAPTFDNSPLLTWNPIARATSYEVFVAELPFGTPVSEVENFEPVFREMVTTNAFQIPEDLGDEGYVFWVRAIQTIEAGPTVVSAWSVPSQFSTLRPVTITGPTAVNGVVTDARPVIEWTRIEDAVRYEVEVRRFNTPPPFLNVQVTGTSFRFQETLPAGDYFVFVRPISSQGQFGPFTPAFAFTSNGGRPIINEIEGQTLLPTITWQAVGDADVTNYEIWISQDGVNFQFLVQDTANATTSFEINTPLDQGSYRVWTRAIFADGSRGLWSDPLAFAGGNVAAVTPEELSVEIATVSADIETVIQPVVPIPQEQDELFIAAATTDIDKIDNPETAHIEHSTVAPNISLPDMDSLTTLAMDCVETEWWTA